MYEVVTQKLKIFFLSKLGPFTVTIRLWSRESGDSHAKDVINNTTQRHTIMYESQSVSWATYSRDCCPLITHSRAMLATTRLRYPPIYLPYDRLHQRRLRLFLIYDQVIYTSLNWFSISYSIFSPSFRPQYTSLVATDVVHIIKLFSPPRRPAYPLV